MQNDQNISTSDLPASLLLRHLAFEGQAWLAPMSGITDVGMRRAARKFGASAVVSEMVASESYVKGATEARLRAEGEGVTPHIVQLAGCEAHSMAEAARLAEASGADIIDINMGCPAKRVTGGWSGSALMRDLDHASGLIEATIKAVDVPVTVKMRLGWDDASINAPELARRAYDLGVELVSVHARTRQQFYKGHANWSLISPVRALFPGILVANGDISSGEDAERCLQLSQADAVMIGRAALGRPWIIGEIAAKIAGRTYKKPTIETMGHAAIEHYETMLSLYGLEYGARHARKHLVAYVDEATRMGGVLSADEQREMVTTTSASRVISLLRTAFSTASVSMFLV